MSGDPASGIAWIEDGIRAYQTASAILSLPLFLALKAEALHLAGRIPEALATVEEAERLVERSEVRYWAAELHRLRGVVLAATDADERNPDERGPDARGPDDVERFASIPADDVDLPQARGAGR